MRQQFLRLKDLVSRWTGTLSGPGTCLGRPELSHGVGALSGEGAEVQEEEAKAERSREGGVERDQGHGIGAGIVRDGETGVGVGSEGGDQGALEGGQKVGTGQNLGERTRRRKSLGTGSGNGKGEPRPTVVPLCRRS